MNCAWQPELQQDDAVRSYAITPIPLARRHAPCSAEQPEAKTGFNPCKIKNPHLNATKVKTFWRGGGRIAQELTPNTETRVATGGK